MTKMSKYLAPVIPIHLLITVKDFKVGFIPSIEVHIAAKTLLTNAISLLRTLLIALGSSLKLI